MSELDNIAQLFDNEDKKQVDVLEGMLRERQVASVDVIGTGTSDGLVIEFRDGSSAVIQAPERQRGLRVEVSK